MPEFSQIVDEQIWSKPEARDFPICYLTSIHAGVMKPELIPNLFETFGVKGEEWDWAILDLPGSRRVLIYVYSDDDWRVIERLRSNGDRKSADMFITTTYKR